MCAAADYAWSSCSAHCGGDWPECLDRAPAWLALGGTDAERARHYRDLLSAPISDEEREAIIRPVQRGQLNGSAHFLDAIAAQLGRRVEIRGPGRPRKGGK